MRQASNNDDGRLIPMIIRCAKIDLKPHSIAWYRTVENQVDGVEVQLLDQDEKQFALLSALDVPVKTIHIDLYTAPKDKYGKDIFTDFVFSLRNYSERTGYGLYLERLFATASSIGAPIVFHIQNDPSSAENLPMVAEALTGIHSMWPGLRFLIENVKGAIPDAHPAYLVPNIARTIGREIGTGTVVQTIIDTCHYYMEHASNFDSVPRFSLKQILSASQMNGSVYMHLNYLAGNGKGENHSLGHASNPELLEGILSYLAEQNADATIVHEQNDDDLSNRPNQTEEIRLVNRILGDIVGVGLC